MNIKTDLSEGVYFVKNKVATKVDSFPFGYEYDADASKAPIIRKKDGTVELFAGPGLDQARQDGRIIDERGE